MRFLMCLVDKTRRMQGRPNCSNPAVLTDPGATNLRPYIFGGGARSRPGHIHCRILVSRRYISLHECRLLTTWETWKFVVPLYRKLPPSVCQRMNTASLRPTLLHLRLCLDIHQLTRYIPVRDTSQFSR